MMDGTKMTDENIIELEERKSFDFFWNEASTKAESYGLILDSTVNPDMASIASVGFGMGAVVIGVHRKWITWEEGEERAFGTLRTMNTGVENIHGFYYHFLDMNTGTRYNKSELSIIDTALFVMGALCAAQYFKGRVLDEFEQIYRRIDWDWYRNKETNQFYMGYDEPAHPGQHVGAWNVCAEQMIMYILACGSPTFPLPADIYYDCPMEKGDYQEYTDIYHSVTGSLFVYQFSHAFIDFRNRKDKRGIDWFENSVKATLANRRFCMEHAGKFKTYGEHAWGLTACDTPCGYSGDPGAPPSFVDNCSLNDGTVPPCGAIGSIVFTPEESICAMNSYYSNPKLWSKYGFIDAYNLDVNPPWYSKGVIGIDKGIGLLMIENYRSGLIWNLVMENTYIKRAMEILEIL